MAMPETAMNEYRQLVLRHDYVWRAWEVSGVQAEAESHSMDNLPNDQFRLCVI